MVGITLTYAGLIGNYVVWMKKNDVPPTSLVNVGPLILPKNTKFAKRMTATWVKILRICYHNLFGFTTLSSYFWKFHQWPHHKRVTYPAKRLHSACGQSHMRACLHPRFCSAFSVVYMQEMNSINMCTTITSTNLSNQYQYIPLWFMFKRCWNVT